MKNAFVALEIRVAKIVLIVILCGVGLLTLLLAHSCARLLLTPWKLNNDLYLTIVFTAVIFMGACYYVPSSVCTRHVKSGCHKK